MHDNSYHIYDIERVSAFNDDIDNFDNEQEDEEVLFDDIDK